MSAEGEPQRVLPFALGLDRVGLVALRSPRVAGALILVLSLLAVLGVMRLKVDDSLSELFRSDTDEFRRYEEVDRRFPSSEYDVLAVVEGKALLTPGGLTAFRTMAIDLNLVEGAKGIVSMLSARDRLDEKGIAAPVVPASGELPTGPAFDAMVKRLRANEIVTGKLLSEDGELALILVALDRDTVETVGLKRAVGEVREAIEHNLAGSGLTYKLTGAPVMQLEIRNAVERDRLIYNGLGFCLGAVVAFLFFRRISLTLIAVAGPSLAILWTLGVIGGLDFRLNLFVNVLTPLILVSAFSDSVHLVTAIRRDILAGVDRVTAARNAVLDVAPACLLTAVNQAISIFSFALAKSALIRTFGLAALIAVAIAYLAVAVVVPTLAALLIRKEAGTAPAEEEAHDGMGVLHRLSERIVGVVVPRAGLVAAAGLAAVVGCGLAYGSLTPHYRLADQVPDRESALDATGRLDKKLTGANPAHVMVSWKSGLTLYSPAVLDVIGEVHRVVEKAAGFGNVWSVESLRRWLRESGDERIETLQRYVRILPDHLVRRFIAADERAVLVTGRLPDVDASQILPMVEALDAALKPVRLAHPEFDISVTGLPAIAARNSARLIGELNVGLVGDIFLVFIFLGLVLRSVLVGVNSILPSLFPIFATGALLYATGEGLQFASIIAITVAFSLAIDSTIHFLNRYRIEEDAVGGSGVAATREALLRTIHHIGPAIMLTTLVLALGLGVTVFSHLPSLRLFGRLAAITLFAALLAQLVILPATVMLFRSYFPRRQ